MRYVVYCFAIKYKDIAMLSKMNIRFINIKFKCSVSGLPAAIITFCFNVKL